MNNNFRQYCKKKIQRIFDIGSKDVCLPISFRRRLICHTITGGIIGLFILHPLAMVFENLFHTYHIDFAKVVGVSLSYEHITMSIYYWLIGSVIGLFQGFYIHKISTLNEDILRQSITDELTGLYNRRFLMSRLEQEIVRAQRYSRPLSLLMIDVDFFKQYNDKHGHPAGDELLHRLGSLFRELVRGADFVVRYGGEEFTIVMPETDDEMAHTMALRICSSVSSYLFKKRETQPGGSVTVSIGLATLSDDAGNVEELIQAADHALYDAKMQGKNRVCRIKPNCQERSLS